MNKFPFLLTFVILGLILNLKILADDYGNLWGLIVNENQNPLQDVRISISMKEKDFDKTLLSDTSGLYMICGLPLGCYKIRFEAQGYKSHIQERVFLEPSQSLYLKVILSSKEKKDKSSSKVLLLDYSNSLHQTILDKFQIQESPSAHNVWALVENQDLSATTNRIDVGGLWGSIPALFSSRGGSSWTQNIYLLNGMDVTDPYWTGMPLFSPDFNTLHYTQLINAGHPSSALSPGAYFNLLTQEGTGQYHGGISAFYIHKKFQSSNISPALENEGIFDSHSFNYSMDSNFYFSGPLIPEKLFLFTSLSTFHLSRDLADFEQEDKASVYSGLVSLDYRYSENTLRFLWTGQIITYPTFGAERYIPFSTTSERRDNYNVFQATWYSRIQDNHFIKAGLCFVHGNIRSGFQEGISRQHGLEILRNIPSGTAPLANRDTRNSLTFLIKGESLIPYFLRASHRFQYGFQLQHWFSSSQKEITENLHLRFFEGESLEIVKYNTPVHHRESAINLNLFAQDSLTFSNFISFYFGIHLASSHGWIPSQNPDSSFGEGFSRGKSKINWFNVSPRFGLIFPLSKAKTSAFKISVARYYFTLPLYLLTYGNSNALGGLVYTWNDLNNDKQYQEGEASTLIRREGPFFSKIDPSLKRPHTDELTISFTCTFGSNWHFSLSGFLRKSRNLIETTNTGVPFSAFEPMEFFDIGDDRIPDTHDDLSFTIYNQKGETLGQDLFLLTNPDSENRKSRYEGLDLTLIKKYSSKFTFFLSFTATTAVGTTSPGNTEWENDDGVIGSLYDNPNTLINTKGRMHFDRGYTGRIGINFLALFGIRIGCIVKYYDGQPFARKIIVSGMNQGPFYIQAHRRGVSRYEYNRTVDIRLEKTLNFGKTKMRIILDGFNIINRGLATEENEWTGPEYPLRFATEIQSPRVFRLGFVYEF